MIRLAFVLCLLAAPAQAATIEYQYVGQPRYLVSGRPLAGHYVLSAGSGIMTISEELLGRSLESTTASFEISYIRGLKAPDWLLAFNVLDTRATIGMALTFTTNKNKQIVSWWGYSESDPDDSYTSNGGDIYSSYEGFRYQSKKGGTWLGVGLPTAIPIPAALPMLAIAIGGLGLFAWRRRT